MSDLALNLLIDHLNQASDSTLLVVDEQTSVNALSSLRRDSIVCLTQRVDQYQQLRQTGFEVLLNDYQFEQFDGRQFNCVAHRVSKQKHLVNHVISSAPALLQSGGRLLLAGAKTEGIKSFAKKLSASGDISRQRAPNQNELYIVQNIVLDTTLAEHNSYAISALGPHYQQLLFISKPGVYGWQKIDKGSQLLVESIPKTSFGQTSRILDLGCGYGFFAVWAAQFAPKRLVATDNNLAAVHCCKLNLSTYTGDNRVVEADCGATIEEQFDIILCNPPFHSGFEVDTTLTHKFLNTSKRLLAPGGRAYFVVNQFIGLETKAKPYFNTCTLINQADGFKVYCLSA